MTCQPASVRTGERRPPYMILIAMSAVGPLGLNMFVPSMPGLQAELSASPATVQLTLTVFLAGMAVSQVIYGPLSDRYGRRPVLLAGLGLFVLASIACALATSVGMLIAARLLQAVGGAAGMIMSRAIVRDLFERERAASVLGYITMAWVLAPMLAPFVGGLLDQVFSFRAGFWLLAVLGALVALAAARVLPETNACLQPDARLVRVALYRTLLANRVFAGYVGTIAFGSAVFFTYLALAPFVMVTLRGHTPLVYGIWFITSALGYMTGNFVSGRYSQAFGNDRMIHFGNMATLAGAVAMFALAMAGAAHPAALFLPMALCAFGNGLTIPNGITAAISVDPRNIGSGAGLAGFIQMSFAACVSQVVGAWQPALPNLGFWVILGCAALAVLARPSRQP